MKQERNAKPKSEKSSGYPWGLAALGAGVVAAGIWGGMHWRETRALEQALPTAPGLEARLTALKERLGRAAAAAAAAPRDATAVAELGRLYHANGYTVEALACWRVLQRLEPEEARWHHYAADACKTLGDYSGMTAAWAEAERLAPNYAPLPLLRAEHLLKTGAVEEAEQAYRRRLGLVAEDPYAQLGLARCAYQQGRVREAHSLLAALVKSRPGFPSAHNFFAEVLAAEGDAAGADEQRRAGRAAGRFKEAADPWLLELRAWCLDSRRLVAWGTVDFQNNDLQSARDLFERAVKVEPDNLRNLEVLADLLVKLGDHEAARALYERYLTLAGERLGAPMLYVSYSETLRVLKRPDQALAVVEQALARGGRTPELVNARGVALSDLGRQEEARAAFREALRIDELDTSANYNLAGMILNDGDLPEGIRLLKRALVREPGNIPTLMLLGQVLLDQGDLSGAGEALSTLWRAQPNLPAAREGMALWHFRSGEAAEKSRNTSVAMKHYDEGLAIFPESAELHRARGYLLVNLERPAEALPSLRELRRLRPEDAPSLVMLAQAMAAAGDFPGAISQLREAQRIAELKGLTQTAALCREILAQAGVK